MQKFSDLNIPKPECGFVGEKIKIHKLFNKQIVIHAYRIEKSKFSDKGNGYRLKLQISFENTKRVVFTGAVGLQDTIQKVPKENFPFETTIIQEESEQFLFT